MEDYNEGGYGQPKWMMTMDEQEVAMNHVARIAIFSLVFIVTLVGIIVWFS